MTRAFAATISKLFFRGACLRGVRRTNQLFPQKILSAFILMIAALGGVRSAWSVCTPPDSIAAQLKTRHDAAIYAELGTWFGDRHQYACAGEAFRKAVEIDPTSAHNTYLLGLSLYSAGQPGEAVKPLQESIRLDPKSADGYLTLGAALDQTGNRADAEAQWRMALAIDPHSALALENLSRDLLADGNYSAVIALLKPMADGGHMAVPLSVNLSVAYSKSGLLEDASALLHAELRENPGSVPLVEALAGVLILQMRVQEATEIVKSAASQHPHDMSVQMLYLRTLVVANDTVKAETLSHTFLVSSPHNWEVLYLTGFLKLNEGDYVASRGYLEQSVALKPDVPESHFYLGVALARIKSNSEAKDQLQKAIALGYSKPEVHFELARVLQALGDAEPAQAQLQIYQQALKAQSSQTQAAGQAALADQAMAAGHVEQAVVFYRNALATDPSEPLLEYKMAMALNKTGDIAGERAALERAIELNPRFALAQNQLGYLDSQDGKTESAERHFRLAVETDPGYTNAWINLAATLCLESEWQEARAAINHVLVLDPANLQAKQLNEQLDAIERKN
ncbi:MAG: tetratricopeptide repeat protein [Silvibacterium sp.]